MIPWRPISEISTIGDAHILMWDGGVYDGWYTQGQDGFYDGECRPLKPTHFCVVNEPRKINKVSIMMEGKWQKI